MKDAIPLLVAVASSADRVILPAPFVTSIPSPAVSVPNCISPFEVWPISIWPLVGAEPSTLVIEPARSNPPMSKFPFVPEMIALLSVASGTKVNLPVLSSKPKKPSFAADPLCHLNSIPLSLLSSEPGAESPPTTKIGSSTVTVVLLTVVCVPLTVKLPSTVRLFPTVTLFGNPIVIVWPLATVSISLVVPAMVNDCESKSTAPVPESPAMSTSCAVVCEST